MSFSYLLGRNLTTFQPPSALALFSILIEVNTEDWEGEDGGSRFYSGPSADLCDI